MKKSLILIWILMSTICCYADRYKIVELKPSPIKIGGRNLVKGDTFDESSEIKWTSEKQYMRVENLSTHNLRKYSSRAMTAKGVKSVAGYRDRVRQKQLSSRDIKSNNPFQLSGMNKSLFPEKRIALVMGNSEYENVSYLENAVYDATVVADNLQALGFDVITCYDAQLEEMHRALRRFGTITRSERYDVAVFYYSGHGVQNRKNGSCYMLPVNINADEDYIAFSSCLAALEVRDSIQEAGCKVNILLFDACRTDMNMRGLSSSAFSMDPGTNTLVMFSTSNGDQAMDKYKGSDNGPFVTALLNGINQPGKEVNVVLDNVRRQVYSLTGRRQTPSVSSSLVEEFYFTHAKPSSDNPKPTSANPKPTPANTSSSSVNILNNGNKSSDEQRFDQAVHAYENSNYSEACKVFRELAMGGHVKAQIYLGFCYEKGKGVPQSYAEAVKWYRKAAEQGYSRAQYNLGVCYGNGNGVPRSSEEAVKWYRKAAEQGFSNAQYNLGNCYYHGNGVPQSYAEAVKWYRKAAEQGHANAQYNLGLCYENGNGVPQSSEEAVKWYRKAAEHGQGRAKNRLNALSK